MRSRLVVLALGNFAVGVATFVIAPILGPITAELGVSHAAGAQLTTGYALTYAAAGPVLAAALGHVPPRRLLCGALAVFAVGNVVTAVAPSYPVALLGRVLAGAGAALYSANALVTARHLVPPARQGRAVATVVGGLTSAIVFGLPLGAWFAQAASWRATLWSVAGLTVLAGAGVLASVPGLPGQPSVSLRVRLAPLTDRHVLSILAATTLCLTASWTVYNYIGPILAPATGGDPGRGSLALCCFGVGAVLGNLLAGRLADRYTPGRVIAGSAPALTLVVLAVPLGATTFPLALALAALWGALHWTVNVPQQLRVASAAPAAAPLVLGLHQTSIYLGIGLGGVVGAAGLGLAGRSGVGYAAFLVGVLALALLALSFRVGLSARSADEPMQATPSR